MSITGNTNEELNDDPTSNPTDNETFEDIVERRLSRRSVIKGMAGAAPVLFLGSTMAASIIACGSDEDDEEEAVKDVPIGFTPVAHNNDDKVTVPAGYEAQVLLRWGDSFTESGPRTANQVTGLTPEQQATAAGSDNDWIGYFPLKDYKSKNSESGLLATNFENLIPALMFPGFDIANLTKAQVDVEMNAHGHGIVEVARTNGKWSYKPGSSLNRRFTANTGMELTGPAAGNEKFKVSYDSAGTKVNGTLNNCGGGRTPWGTILTCEENFNGYFANLNDLPDSDARKAIHRRYGVTAGASGLGWERFYDRFNVGKDPNEAFRFGWVVEINPYDPNSTPKKRTALGRFKHEAASVVVADDGRAVVYMGDDERFDYVYKFVTEGKVNTSNLGANADLLDKGTLFVAKFSDTGAGEWVPLIHGQGPLNASNGFMNQGDVVINARGASDLLGATKMDRPEDIEVSPVTGRVYVAMTNNTNRTGDQVNRANPRPANKHGHIVEFTEANDDATATSFSWNMFIQAGDPKVEADGAYFAGYDQSKVSWLSCPDNFCFGPGGHLWITTDGQPGTIKSADTAYVVPVDGLDRGYLRPFLTGPVGAEITGPEFTPDGTTFFVSIQHPGEGSGASIENPLSRWPDNASPARNAIIAVVKNDGGIVGT